MSAGTNQDEGAAGPLFSRPTTWIGIVALGLAAWIYQPLFFPPSHTDLALQSEEFFFEANEAAGAPVLALAAWLFYRRSHYLDLFRSGGEWMLGGGVLALAVALYAWGHYTGAPDLQLASAIPFLFGAVIALGGRAAARAFWVPIVFLGFALPLPPVPLSAAIFPIQLLTAEYAGVILNALGVKSLVQGDQILRPENTFIVIETCSGVRTIVTLSMLTVLLIDLFERRGKHALILLVLAPLVAFVTNGFRVVSLVLNPHSSIASIHNLQGIMMLLVGLAILYGLDALLERTFGPPEEHASDDAEAAPARGTGPGLVPALVVVLALGAMASSARLVTPYAIPSGFGESPSALIQRVFSDGASREIPPDYQFRGSIRYLLHADRLVRFEGAPIEVFLGVGNERIRTHTLLSPRLAWPQSGWVPIEEEVVDLGAGANEVRRVVLERGGSRMVSYSFVLRAGSLTAEAWRQAAALDRSPFERAEHMLAVRLSARVPRGETRLREAEQRIRRAWARLAPELDGYAPLRPDDAAALAGH